MSYYYGYYGYGGYGDEEPGDAADAPADVYYEEAPAEEMEEEDDGDSHGMAKLVFALVVAADAYCYFGYASDMDSTKTTAEAAGVTWADQDWGKYETQAIIGFASKAGLMLLAMFIEPIADLFWLVALLSVGEEGYKYSLLSTALDGTTYTLPSDSSFEGAATGAIGFGAVGSLYVALAKMGGSDDDEEEADYEEYYEESAPAEEEPEDDGGDAYGGYYGYYY